MKQILLVVFLMTTIYFANGQNTTLPVRSISVNGLAEMEVVPDEIYVQVNLSEYKKGNIKIDIEIIRKQFLAAMAKLGYTEKDIAVEGYTGWDGIVYTDKKKKPTDLLAGIQYLVKVASPQKMDELVKNLDDAATTNFFIAKTSHSKLTEFKKQLKIAAIKAAKEKAQYLSEAIDEKVGKAITINEPAEMRIFPNQYANTLSKVSMEADEESEPITTDFTKIKLQFTVDVVFQLI